MTDEKESTRTKSGMKIKGHIRTDAQVGELRSQAVEAHGHAEEAAAVILNSARSADVLSRQQAQAQQFLKNQKRVGQREQHLQQILANRIEPGGDVSIRVSWEQFEKMHSEYREARLANRHHDFPFQPFSAYAQHITHYADGRPRVDAEGNPKPVRMFMENEVGMYMGKFVILDRNPGDLGSGTEHQVPAAAPVPERGPQLGEDVPSYDVEVPE